MINIGFINQDTFSVWYLCRLTPAILMAYNPRYLYCG